MNQCHQYSYNEYVDHGPLADELGDLVHDRALFRSQRRMPLHSPDQVEHGDQLAQRNHDTGDEDNRGDRDATQLDQQDDATDYGAGLRLAELVGVHDGQDVGRDVQKAGGDQQRYAALQAVFLPRVHGGAAARAVMGVQRRQLQAGVT